MALTTQQINDLNNSMVAAQNVSLGTLLSGMGAVVSGSFAPAAASTNIVTDLSTVSLAFASLSGSPVLNHTLVSATAGSVAGTITVKCWKPTSTSDTTPVAATGTMANVVWIAIGSL